MRILVVDDDDLAIEALQSVLANAGYEIEVAHDGFEALETIRSRSCRIVVSDWMMPGMNGLELCRRIRREDFPGYIYVILLTSRDRKTDIVEGLSAGADDLVV